MPEDPSAQPDELLEARDGHVATLTLNRPAQRNALSTNLLAALASSLSRLDVDPAVRCIIVTGSDKVFASGADLRDLRNADVLANYRGARAAAWAGIRQLRTPTVAAVSGYCLGGGLELAMGCDVIIASETARFGLPETMLGLIPAAGGTQRLPRAIGRAKALDVILTGRLLTAEEADQAGLVSRLATADTWLTEAHSVGQAIAARGPLAQALAKETVDAGSDVTLAAGLILERRAFAMALGSEEAREGIDAFLEKRSPHWSSAPPP